MKLSPSRLLSEYGHVLFASLAAVIGSAALSSQWLENHRLRQEVQRLHEEQNVSVEAIRLQTTRAQVQERTYIRNLNKWIDGFNHFAAEVNATIKSTNKNAQSATDQRNAQCLVSMYQAGAAAGVVWKGSTKEAKMQEVIQGGTPDSGPFAGKVFKMLNLSQSAQASAAKYIRDDGEAGLAYDREGTQPGPTGASDPAPTVADTGEPVFPVMPKLPEPDLR